MRLPRLLVLLILAVPSGAAAQTPVDPTATLLAELIRVNTSNPPGNERGIAELLAPRFIAAGFQVDVIPTPDSGKAHFIARLRGDGSKRPILLAAHADVVGVEREKWTLDPFAGVIKDGYVFGRGAIDFKGGMAVFARAALMLAERKVPLARDVIFLAEADEEGALPYSTTWLAQHHWDKIDAEFSLNEGGWIIKRPDGRVRYVSISTADKSSIGITLTARGTSTHSSMPRPDNAIFALARALAKLSEYETPVLLTPSTRQFFAALGRSSEGAMAEHFRNLTSDNPELVRRADRAISQDPLLRAIMRNTLAPVIINGGFRSNVIPGSAQATINARLIPGSDPAELVREMQRVIADTSIEVRGPAAGGGRGVPESSDTTALFRALANQARRQWPGAEVTPYLFQAGTDARPWRSRGIPVYGIYPYPIDADDLTRMHGNDERVPIESLRQGTEMIYRTLVEVAGRK
jgi:acetylornithine deacetylase/succinyl-diaminopimelate desuccinylase-like protein